jgi:hypothetical protein
MRRILVLDHMQRLRQIVAVEPDHARIDKLLSWSKRYSCCDPTVKAIHREAIAKMPAGMLALQIFADEHCRHFGIAQAISGSYVSDCCVVELMCWPENHADMAKRKALHLLTG